MKTSISLVHTSLFVGSIYKIIMENCSFNQDFYNEDDEAFPPPLPVHRTRLFGDEEVEEDEEIRLAMQVSRTLAEADAEEEALQAILEASLLSAVEDENRRERADIDSERRRVLSLINRVLPIIQIKLASLPSLREERRMALHLFQRYKDAVEKTHLGVVEEEFTHLYVILNEVQKRSILSTEEHNDLLAHFMAE